MIYEIQRCKKLLTNNVRSFFFWCDEKYNLIRIYNNKINIIRLLNEISVKI